MPDVEWTDYEFEVAQAIAQNPSMLCFDALGLFKFSWEGELEMVDDWQPGIVQVDICQIQPLDAKSRTKLNRKFLFPPFATIATVQTKLFPDSMTVIVNESVITEEIVLKELRRILQSRKYQQYENRFLWGPKVLSLDSK